ncbi:AAA family ATPase [Mycolicibacterium sp. 018/SC-01/001]|uniref:ATP-binding protein n=1 Tax=Mycolicibacterium sp. 018/SC-01/001 TaxID=2592069 RepID=UPI00117F7610|nr:SbcC/MukB-like Walker B domain-containing protein [Mycolicibacterium sp. 018/SC-01/001]TRW89184.1 AAA family ATPase [Mycolicibacterium sp. 018/SC-01/001]
MTTNKGEGRQFWLSRLQIINWGVFDGYHSMTFTRHGTLITGQSGTGKSSLLDAISLAFLSSARRNFNASSDTTAAGSGLGKRTVDKYVRGLWGELKAPGERAKQMYLRGEGSAWSAIAITYSGTDGSTVTGLVLKWLAAGADTDSSSRWFLIHEAPHIHALCNTWAARNYSSAVFEGAGWKPFRHERPYLDQLYTIIGIQGSAAAQQLLGKAKSLKSVGGLEQFVREYMLDEPESLTGVADALGQITPLVEARNALAVVTRQRSTLGDIEQIQLTYVSESAQLAAVDIVDQPMVRAWVDHQRRDRARPEIERLTDEINRLGTERDTLTTEQDELTGKRDELIARINQVDKDLAPLKTDIARAKKVSEQTNALRARYDTLLDELGYSELQVDNAADFETMRTDSQTEITRIDTELTAGRDAYHRAAGVLSTARERLTAVTEELTAAERATTSVPLDEDRMRAMIIADLGVAAKHLPYVCELLDLRPGQERWRKAVEKVLRSTGLCLLVPDRFHQRVLQFVNAHHMGGLLQIERVSADTPARTPDPGSLAECLKLSDPRHECVTTAYNLIARAGNYIRVDKTEDFSRHRRAVTDQGLRQENERRAVKDDRRELRLSEYIFRGNPEEKRAALRAERQQALAALNAATEAMTAKDTDRDRLNTEARRWSALYNDFAQWRLIDTDAADAEVQRLEDQLATLMQQNPNLKALESQAEDYRKQANHCGARIGVLDNQINTHDERRTALLRLLEHAKPAELGAHSRACIETYVQQVPLTLDVLAPEPYRHELWRQIEKEQQGLRESVGRSRRDLSRILTNFDRDFPDAIPNDGDNFDEKVHDYVELCRRIDSRDLPTAHERMLRLITEQAPTAVLRLYQLAEDEAHRIEDQIARVNIGLGAVDFNRGTRLTLRADPKTLHAVADLKERARRISARIPDVAAQDRKAVHDQYQDILDLRNLLASESAETRQWTRDALDVRNRFVLYCEESDATTGTPIRTYSNAGANSGGEQEKLMAFCLAGALSYNLADPRVGDNRPVFSQLMLDEAFSKSDPQFAQQALSAFRKFGFQLVIVATVQNSTTIQPYIDSVIMVAKDDRPGARPVASTKGLTIEDFANIEPAAATAPAAVTAVS